MVYMPIKLGAIDLKNYWTKLFFSFSFLQHMCYANKKINTIFEEKNQLKCLIQMFNLNVKTYFPLFKINSGTFVIYVRHNVIRAM